MNFLFTQKIYGTVAIIGRHKVLTAVQKSAKFSVLILKGINTRTLLNLNVYLVYYKVNYKVVDVIIV